MLRLFVKSILVCWCIQTAYTQDVHLSSVRLLPTFFNPAYTGFFDKDVRAGLIYRNQSHTYTKAYNTLGYGVDFSLLKQKTDNNSIIGVGVNGYYDRAGALRFSDNSIMLNFSYIQALDKQQRFYLSFGINAGYAFRKIDLSRVTLEEGFNGIDGFVNTAGDLENATNNHLKLGAGCIAFFNLSEKIKFHVGFAAYDLAKQNLSFLNNTDIKQKPRLMVNFGLDANFNKITIQPYFLTQLLLPQKEIVLGSVVKYNSDNQQYNFSENNYSIGGGLGYRYGDAVIISAIAEYKNFTLNVAYDFNISKWSRASKTVGAIEIGIVYKNGFISQKDKKYKPLSCPNMYF